MIQTQDGRASRTRSKEDVRYVIKPKTHYARRFRRKSWGYIRALFSAVFPFMSTRGIFLRFAASLTIDPENWHTNPDPKNPDWMDINKLIGVAFGGVFSVHKDSYRIGWIHDYTNPGYVNLYHYWYVDGERNFSPVEQPICRVHTGEPLELVIATIADTLYVRIAQGPNELYEGEVPFKRIGKGLFTLLEPYHGGQLKAVKRHVFNVHKIQFDYNR